MYLGSPALVEDIPLAEDRQDWSESEWSTKMQISWANVCQLNKKRSVPAHPVLTSFPLPTYVYLLKIWTQLVVLRRIWTPLLVVRKRLLVNLLEFLACCKL